MMISNISLYGWFPNYGAIPSSLDGLSWKKPTGWGPPVISLYIFHSIAVESRSCENASANLVILENLGGIDQKGDQQHYTIPQSTSPLKLKVVHLQRCHSNPVCA